MMIVELKYNDIDRQKCVFFPLKMLFMAIENALNDCVRDRRVPSVNNEIDTFFLAKTCPRCFVVVVSLDMLCTYLYTITVFGFLL